MTLPTTVIERDRTLQKAADELMELRWHWTLDESNPDRVSQAAYARAVRADPARINVDAHAWADFLAHVGKDAEPGEPQTPDDHRQLRKLSAERKLAAKAVARTTGKRVASVATHARDEVDAVVNTARERAVERGTTVDHEIERAAEWRAKARKANERERDERRRRSTARFIQIEGDLGAAMQRLRSVLGAAQDVEFTDEERDLIVSALNRMRALLGLIDLRIAGEVDVDWDTELANLTES